MSADNPLSLSVGFGRGRHGVGPPRDAPELWDYYSRRLTLLMAEQKELLEQFGNDQLKKFREEMDKKKGGGDQEVYYDCVSKVEDDVISDSVSMFTAEEGSGSDSRGDDDTTDRETDSDDEASSDSDKGNGGKAKVGTGAIVQKPLPKNVQDWIENISHDGFVRGDLGQVKVSVEIEDVSSASTPSTDTSLSDWSDPPIIGVEESDVDSGALLTADYEENGWFQEVGAFGVLDRYDLEEPRMLIAADPVPLDQTETWDFSLQGIDPTYRSKVVWVESAGTRELHQRFEKGKCLHEITGQPCQCPGRKKVKEVVCPACDAVLNLDQNAQLTERVEPIQNPEQTEAEAQKEEDKQELIDEVDFEELYDQRDAAFLLLRQFKPDTPVFDGLIELIQKINLKLPKVEIKDEDEF